MKELHSCTIKCITHTHTRNSSFETTTSNSNFVFKNFSRASSHSTSPWPRGNCLPDRAEIFINFLPPWSRSIRRYTRRSYTPPPPIPAATKTSASTLRHLPSSFPFERLSPLNICRCIFQTCPPSNGTSLLSLTLFITRDNDNDFPDGLSHG